MRKVSKWLLVGLLALSLSVPTMAYATPEEGDQNDLSADEIASALANGEVDTTWPGGDDDGIAAFSARSGYAMRTLAGETRYPTSAKEALSAFPSGAQTVIVAGGEGYADSIAAAGLAGALDCPILLTSPSSLLDETRDAIKTLAPKKIIILGGGAAVSGDVETSLRSLVGGKDNVTRLSGDDRYGTQMDIFNYGVKNKLWTGDTAIVAYGENFADALSVSPISYALKAPVFFTDKSTDLSAVEKKAIKESGKTKFLVIGGTAVVKGSVDGYLGSLGKVVRKGGDTRYDTSKFINEYAVSTYGFTWDGVAFTSGQAPYDALGGGAMQGKEKKLLSLLDNNGPRTEPDVKVPGKPSDLVFIGGKNVYSNAFKAQVAWKMGYRLTDIEGFRVYIDAGHGWNSSGNGVWDSGATGSGYYEANLTSDLADRVANHLRDDYGLDVYVNKSGWYKLRQAQASELDCGALVSIHFNADGGSGSEAYIHDVRSPWGSTRLQSAGYWSLVNHLDSPAGLPARGMHSKRLAVLSGNVPSTLLEICFIDNHRDMNAYMSRIDDVASSIAWSVAFS